MKHIKIINIFLEKVLLWILGDAKTINFCDNNWMKDSHLIDKINLNMSHYILENAKVIDLLPPLYGKTLITLSIFITSLIRLKQSQFLFLTSKVKLNENSW